MEQNYEKIKSSGAELIAISSEGIERTRKTVENEGLSYPVLSDTNKDVINAFNVLDQNSKTIARPATFIISTEGKVAWISLDAAASRVPTATILAELGKL